MPGFARPGGWDRKLASGRFSRPVRSMSGPFYVRSVLSSPFRRVGLPGGSIRSSPGTPAPPDSPVTTLPASSGWASFRQNSHSFLRLPRGSPPALLCLALFSPRGCAYWLVGRLGVGGLGRLLESLVAYLRPWVLNVIEAEGSSL